MTLDKHKLDGIPQIAAKTLPVQEFDALLINAGYTKIGTASARETVSRCGGAIQRSGELKPFIVLTKQLQLLPITSLERVAHASASATIHSQHADYFCVDSSQFWRGVRL